MSWISTVVSSYALARLLHLRAHCAGGVVGSKDNASSPSCLSCGADFIVVSIGQKPSVRATPTNLIPFLFRMKTLPIDLFASSIAVVDELSVFELALNCLSRGGLGQDKASFIRYSFSSGSLAASAWRVHSAARFRHSSALYLFIAAPHQATVVRRQVTRTLSGSQ